MKNSVGNVRRVIAELTVATGQEAGVNQAALRRLDERKSGSVILLDRSGAEVARYTLVKAVPRRYSATLTTEQIELAVEKADRVSSR